MKWMGVGVLFKFNDSLLLSQIQGQGAITTLQPELGSYCA